MESTTSAGDAQDNAADSRTMGVQHDNDESPTTTESEEGWHTVYYGRRRKPGHESVRDADGVHGANNKAKLISTKRTSTRALDIETRKTTTNKIPLRFKKPQPCKLPPQFQVGIVVYGTNKQESRRVARCSRFCERRYRVRPARDATAFRAVLLAFLDSHTRSSLVKESNLYRLCPWIPATAFGDLSPVTASSAPARRWGQLSSRLPWQSSPLHSRLRHWNARRVPWFPTSSHRRSASVACTRVLWNLISSAKAVRLHHEQAQKLCRVVSEKPTSLRLPVLAADVETTARGLTSSAASSPYH
ncbi:hypothetical protein MRX96_055223 [Rhipicephalus microplus]